jgi:hypothetical protein
VTRRRAPLVLGLLAVLLGMAPGVDPGGNPGCRRGVSVEVQGSSTPGVPARVTTNAEIVCPTPESQAGGGSFGPSGPIRQDPPGTPGQPCTTTVLEPMELSLTPGGQELVFWPDPSFPGTGSDTPEPQDVGRVISGIGAKDFFMQAGTTDYYNPFRLKGKWDATGFRCEPLDPNNPQGSFTPICTGATIAIGCLIARGHAIGGGGFPPGLLPGGLAGVRDRAQNLIRPGQITSLPAQPNPALVNAPACFFVNGANIDGGDVNQPAEFQMVLVGPADATRRQVFYIIRIQLQLTDVRWTFGDGNDQVSRSLPRPCQGVSDAPLQFSHNYLRYSGPNGFAVSATEVFSLSARAYWNDSAGNQQQDLGPFDPIEVQPAPGQFQKVVVQEEGVPIG